jgi:predicted nucleic acid-binding protein
MRDKALEVIQRLPQGEVFLPVQALGELFHVLVRKAKRRPAGARPAVLGWRDAYPVVDTSESITASAKDLAADHGLSIRDSVVLSAAAEAGCRLLLSEDLHEVLTWGGFTVTNPFARALHPLLAGGLAARGE